jgi:hypothetical protein
VVEALCFDLKGINHKGYKGTRSKPGVRIRTEIKPITRSRDLIRKDL